MGENKGRQQGRGRGLRPFRISCVIYKLLRSGMLKLELQYFGHLIRRVDPLEKTLMLEGLGAGGEGDDRG